MTVGAVHKTETWWKLCMYAVHASCRAQCQHTVRYEMRWEEMKMKSNITHVCCPCFVHSTMSSNATSCDIVFLLWVWWHIMMHGKHTSYSMAFVMQETDTDNMKKPSYQVRDMRDAVQHCSTYKTVTVSCTRAMRLRSPWVQDISHHVWNLSNVSVHTPGTERKEKKRLRLLAPTTWEAKYYAGLPRDQGH